MELLVAFALFIAGLIACLCLDVTMLVPLLFGLLLFGGVATLRGYSVREVRKMAFDSAKNSLIVIRVMLLIGCLTGLWRASGTIAFFVYYGVNALPPSLFVLSAFLLSSLMSYALGTSFGVTATCGVILMAIARAGGVNPVVAAGAVYAGVYVGDRGSPSASSANLVAVVTGTDMRDNIRRMAKTSAVPFAACIVLYAALSVFFPLGHADSELLDGIGAAFRMSWLCLLPAAVMLILPFCRVSIALSMGVSIVLSFALSVLVQGNSFTQTLLIMLGGFRPDDAALAALFGGGGVTSMLEVCGILLVSGTYGGIFRESGLLEPTDRLLCRLTEKIGRYPTVLLTSLAACAVFCNQTIGVIMQDQLTASLYGDSPEEREQKMIEMEDSVIVTAGLIPWCIACSVPLSMMGVGYGAALLGFYVWLLPLWRLLKGRKKV